MTANTEPTIERVDIMEAEFSLPEPLIVGGGIVTSRTYTFVRLTSSSGEEGCAYAITRGLPVAAVIERLIAPKYVGEAITEPAATHERVTKGLGFLTTDSGVSRGMSLMDIALWDLAGKHLGFPVSHLIGQQAESLPQLMVVDGYLPASGDTTAARRHAAETLDSGTSMIKFAWVGDATAMRNSIKAVAPETVGGGASAVVDLLWTLPSIDVGRQVAESLQGIDLDWLEDPYPAHVLRSDSHVAAARSVPIAFGDEATDRHLLDELMTANHIDVLRIDATSLGGLTSALEVTRRAHELGCPVACHIYPEVHQHLAYSTARAEFLEMFPKHGRCDASDQFRTETVGIANGTVAEPTDTGLGLRLDWETIARRSRVVEMATR